MSETASPGGRENADSEREQRIEKATGVALAFGNERNHRFGSKGEYAELATRIVDALASQPVVRVEGPATVTTEPDGALLIRFDSGAPNPSG